MKICVIICEFNPFHNGHAYLLEQARRISGCDALLCVMAGSFTQRGEAALLDKFTRARHAVQGGADAVLELPAPFAVAPAEIFARGAIKLISSIPQACAIAFGCEDADADFVKAAELLGDESRLFKKTLAEGLGNGQSYIRSYAQAFEACGGDKDFLSKPNNVLGVEYVKALKFFKKNLQIIPVKRKGPAHGENACGQFSSSGAIRKNLAAPETQLSVPPFVYNDLKGAKLFDGRYESVIKYSLHCADRESLKKIYGCGEGLENRLKSLCRLPLEQIIAQATGKRYPSSRIQRILCANCLKLYSDDAEKFLGGKLYLKPLAVKKELADEILSVLANAEFPLAVRERDRARLSSEAQQCMDKEIFADGVRTAISGVGTKYFTVLNV